MIKSFRLQLTAWYLLLFTLLFLAFSIFLYSVLSKALARRMDETLSSEVATAAGLFRDEMAELNGDRVGAAREAMAEMTIRGVLVAVFADDQLLGSSSPFNIPDLQHLIRRAAAAHNAEILTTVARPGSAGARVVARGFVFGGKQYVVIAVESLESIQSELAVVRRVLYLALPLVLLIAGIGGFLLAARNLAPLRWMADQARNITDKNLHNRLDVGNAQEELQVLSDSFNELLARLDQSFETMRRFVADASHELRTPIAVIRGEADVALGHERKPQEYQESLAIIQDEARRLSRLVDDLLNLARADAGHVNLRLEEFYLNDLLAECCRSVQASAGAHDVQVECSCPADVVFRGDQELLRRLVLNLLDNAVRFTPAGGKVAVRLETAEGGVCIQVADTGVGIPPELAAHVFERFYRGDQARSRQNGGFGLGLSIVKWIAESHNGTVQLESRPGKGSTFTVLLRR
ncbi:MAG TPA: heavy metal sensor histidine kinase [Bryobacteraceae bacterium]|nr:heavy metal sensor histidine kinase [Bryobacteraceae bacterium]